MTHRARRLLREVWALTRVELILTLRSGENVLVTLVIPALLLVLFASVDLAPSDQPAMDYLFPGVVALSVISTGMVSLGIATAFQRQYGVLKRLGGTPLPRVGLLAAKAASVMAIELVAMVALGLIAVFAYDWTPPVGALTGLAIVLLGMVTFAGIGLAMAGALRAEATLAGANGLYILFLLGGDLVVPLSRLPSPVAAVAGYLPATALSRSLRVSLGLHVAGDWWNLLLLGFWASVVVLIAGRTFRWE